MAPFADFSEVVGGLVLGALALISVGLLVAYFAGISVAIKRHLGVNWRKATVLTRPLLNWERVNLFLALEHLHKATPDAGRVLSLGYHNELASALQQNAARNAPLEYAVRPVSLTETVKVVSAGLYLLHPPGLPAFAAALTRTSLEVMAATPEEAQTCLDRVLAEAKRRNVFRGQVLVVEQAGYS